VDNLKQAVGEKIRAARHKAKLSQQALAVKCEISVSHVASMEVGRRSPSVEMLGTLANAMGTTPKALLP
jgi:transcriptional regulator with XRE-family HTH domain